MIHAKVTRNATDEIDVIHFSVTAESIENFKALMNRALNTWDNAPVELKELGDMVVQGKILQDYSNK